MDWCSDIDCVVPIGFFQDVKYYTIGGISQQIDSLLKQGGAEKHQYLSDILTHCIADEFDEEVTEAKELFQLDVVKSIWVTKSLQCKKLLPTKAFDADFSSIFFVGITACPSQLSKKDHHIIWGLVTMYGGKYKTVYDNSTTHLITNIASGKKYESAFASSVKIVCTNWVLDCVLKKKKLFEFSYHPRYFVLDSNSFAGLDGSSIRNRYVKESLSSTNDVLHERNSQPPDETLNKTTSLNQVRPDQHYLGRDSVETNPDKCFSGCIFYIGDYSNKLDVKEIALWRRVITHFGGQVDDSYSSRVTHVLCEHQESDVYHQASKDQNTIVTASWLNDCIMQKQVLHSFNVLHVPHSFGKRKPCSNQIISITNFTGPERIFVKKLVLLVGAKYTGCMTRSNSLLVAKDLSGNKYLKAVEWKIPVVNISWLLDTSAGISDTLKYPPSPQYTVFETSKLPDSSTSKLQYIRC